MIIPWMLVRVIVRILNTYASPFQKPEIQVNKEVLVHVNDKFAPTAVRLVGRLLVHHRTIEEVLAGTISCAVALIGLSIRYDISPSTAEHFSTPALFEDKAEQPKTISPLEDSPARFI
jgi:hypothetical protein